MDDQHYSLRDQVVAINHWLEQIYNDPLPLSALLSREGLDAAVIGTLKQQHLAAFLARLQSDLCAWLGSTLDERRAHILIRRFSLDGRAKTLLATLGTDEGVSRERIRQIEQGAVRRLRTGKRRVAIAQVVLRAAQATLGLPVTARVEPEQPPAPVAPEQPDSSQPAPPSDTFQQTLELFVAGHSPAVIAERRYLTLETIYNHLARWIERGEVAVDEVIDPDLYEAIERAILQAGLDADSKAIKALLPEVLYGQVACVRADLRRAESPELREPDY
jgi:hypothetical protein